MVRFRLNSIMLGLTFLLPFFSSQAKENGPNTRNVSHVAGKTDLILRGDHVCRIDFAYGGRGAETLLWEERCAFLTATMVTSKELRTLRRWTQLSDLDRASIHALPEGKVLYVEGSNSASVYPVGTSGVTYEVPIAD